MAVNAAALRELHRIHQQLSDLRDRLDSGPKQIRIRTAAVAQVEEQLAKLHGELKTGRVAMDSKQLLLKTGESKIAELKVKLNQANTNREYQALRDQIAADEMANSVLADEILEAMEKLDGLKAHVPEHEARVAKAKEELAKAQQKVLVRRGNAAIGNETAGRRTDRRRKSIARRFSRAVPASGQSQRARRHGENRRGKLRRLLSAAYFQHGERNQHGPRGAVQIVWTGALPGRRFAAG